MRIAIAGASGFIGTALSDHLRAAGHQVVPMVRATGREAQQPADSSPGADTPRPTGKTSGDAGPDRIGPDRIGPDRIGWDPAAGVLEATDLIGCDAVVNLAGPGIADHRWTPSYRKLLRDARVDSTALISNALASLARDDATGRPTTLINGSAIGWYGDRGDEELTEDSPAGEGFLPELCRDWERATQPASEAGVDVAILRTGIVLSPHGGALAKMLPLFRWFLGGRLGSGRQWMSWISLRDEVAAIEYLLEHPTTGTFNATAPHPVRNSDFTKLLAGTVKRPAIIPVPAFGPRLLLGRDLANALLFDSQRVLPGSLSEAGFTFSDPYLDGALNAMLS